MNPTEEPEPETSSRIPRPISNRVNHMRLWAAAGIILVLVLLSFVLSVPHTRELPNTAVGESATPSLPIVVLNDVYRKGTHTITGSIEAPNPCTTLSATASLVGASSSPQSILVDITMPEDTGVCLQEGAKLPFSTTIQAPAKLPIQVTVNGVTATTTAS